MTVWEEGSDPREELNENEFRVLVFPAKGENIAWPAGASRRAILVDLEELKQEKIGMWSDGGASLVEVPSASLTCVPPTDAADLVARLNGEIAKWGDDTDWRWVKFDVVSSAIGTRATLSLKHRVGIPTTIRCTYEVRDQMDIRPVSLVFERLTLRLP